MANLDTTSKRRSHLNLYSPWKQILPLPTLVFGDIDQGDRQHFAYLYSGILAGGAAAGVVHRGLLLGIGR